MRQASFSAPDQPVEIASHLVRRAQLHAIARAQLLKEIDWSVFDSPDLATMTANRVKRGRKKKG